MRAHGHKRDQPVFAKRRIETDNASVLHVLRTQLLVQEIGNHQATPYRVVTKTAAGQRRAADWYLVDTGAYVMLSSTTMSRTGTGTRPVGRLHSTAAAKTPAVAHISRIAMNRITVVCLEVSSP